ncbi:Putative disease resistance protein RGA3 [Linum grandiflorum]
MEVSAAIVGKMATILFDCFQSYKFSKLPKEQVLLIQKLGTHEFLVYFRQGEDIVAELKSWEKQLRRKLKEEADSPSTSKIQSLIPTCFYGISLQTLKFHAEMMSKIQDVTARLRKITSDKDDLDLKNIYGRSIMGQQRTERLPTTALVNESRVYGREKDEQAILQLLKAEAAYADIPVIPIIGMGGLGKTTLAQLVLSRAKTEFDFTAWVSVGEDFDIHRMTKTILDLDGSEGKDLSSLQEQLKEKLSRKKFLIVLDDVWNENYEKWVLCRAPLENGSSGSKIVVTTRNASVASIMGTDPPYVLKELAFNGCLSLFAEHALGARTFAAHSDLEEIGNQIVKKCQGLPLAVKVTGGLLRGKQNPREWEEVLNSEIWEFPESNGVLPALRLSYYHLPSHLKQCFAYCGILPKDIKFEKDELVLLWMAEGFLAQAKEKNQDAELADMKHKQCIEDLDLEWSSNFRCSSNATDEFKVLNLLMPHLKLRKLWIKFYAGIQFPMWVGDLKFADMVHLELMHCKNIESLPPLGQLPSLVTLAISGLDGVKEVGAEFYGENRGNNSNLTWPFPALETLRIEDMPEWVEWSCFAGVTESSTVYFPKLLDLAVRNCPKLIGQLPNFLPCLQNLEIRGCRQLTDLPETLLSLSELYICDCDKMIPVNLCSLKSLAKLSLERLSSPTGMQEVIMEGLGGLARLKDLCIEGCDQLLFLGEGEEGLLPSTLESLWISGCPKLEKLSNGLHKLTHLSRLYVQRCPKLASFGEQGLPSSIGDVFISDCPSLKSLVVRDMNTIEESNQMSYHLERLILHRCSSLTIFPTGKFMESLKTLTICNLTTESLEELSHLALPHLTDLLIEESPELERFPEIALPNLHFIKLLRIRRCSNLRSLPNQLPELTSLLCLEVSGCRSLKSLPRGGLPSNLIMLMITDCESLMQPISEWGINKLTSLKGLGITDECPSTRVSFFPDDKGIWLPTSLTFLFISKFSELKCVSRGLRCLTSLEELLITYCPKLQSLPEGLPPSLGSLKLHACPGLEKVKKQCLKRNGEFWPAMQQIPCVTINSWQGP